MPLCLHLLQLVINTYQTCSTRVLDLDLDLDMGSRDLDMGSRDLDMGSRDLDLDLKALDLDLDSDIVTLCDLSLVRCWDYVKLPYNNSKRITTGMGHNCLHVRFFLLDLDSDLDLRSVDLD